MINYTIEAMRAEDWPAVRDIYLEGLATDQATFETRAPEWEAWDTSHRPDCRLVIKVDGQVVGWAALSPVSRRQVYAGVAEVSIYLAASVRGQGLGKVLLQALVEASEQAGVWTLQASIFPENVASITLHKACGFREVGYRERIAQHHGVWRNTVMVERRSRVVGN
jgi:phosphinothricin acetyltransferase